jgi:formyltetrahydrofolate synthetase
MYVALRWNKIKAGTIGDVAKLAPQGFFPLEAKSQDLSPTLVLLVSTPILVPAQPTEPKLIPIVTTATEADAVELVHTYTRRWPAQENAIRDWLIPLGIDINHGYAKTVVANSEVTKKREALQKRLLNVQLWTGGGRKRMHNASKLYRKRCQQTKERADELYRVLNDHQMEMELQGVPFLGLGHRGTGAC